MNKASFDNEILRARTMVEYDRKPDYWYAFQDGLKRQFYGDKYSSQAIHDLLLNQVHSSDACHRLKGKGYRDGFYFRPVLRKS